MVKLFTINERMPYFGWTDEDNCKFYSYLVLYRYKRAFQIEREAICSLCASEEHLKVHHIIPFTDFGSHSPDNLIVLCSECHKAVHRGEKKINQEGILDKRWIREYESFLELNKKYGKCFFEEVVRKILAIDEILFNSHIDFKRVPFDSIIIKSPQTLQR